MTLPHSIVQRAQIVLACAAGDTNTAVAPPRKATLPCVDEKTQLQALDRTQPLLPMGLGCVEGLTDDTVRYGAAPSAPPWTWRPVK